MQDGFQPACCSVDSASSVPTLQKIGRIVPGTVVEASREEGEEDYERATVKAIDATSAFLDLDFGDGFVRKRVSVASVKFLSDEATPAAEDVAPPEAAEDAAYAAEVGPTLPLPPTPEDLEADAECKYAYIRAYKDAGNALFKAGKYAWAIRTYEAGVNALARNCYESRERMLWDYFARGPCGQCYSNAALCALKQSLPGRAAELCELAMSCRPEDTDLVKVLLRHGQALLALSKPEEAKELLEKAADKEPSNRAVREELLKAKKAVKELAKEGEKRLFQSVDLTKKGLTSKKDSVLEQLAYAMDKGQAALVEHRDDEALSLLEPVLNSKAAMEEHRKPTTMLAAYGVGCARYHKREMAAAIAALQSFFALKADLDANGVDYSQPLMGVPLARFYCAHALFETRKMKEAHEQLGAYLTDVAEAGPQRILNMPSGMLGGKQITDAERAASRFKVRACSPDAQADAHTMLGIIAERVGGPSVAVEHFEAALRVSSADFQKAECHANLAKTYEALKEEDKAEEHQRLAAECTERAEKAAEEAQKKKAEEAAQEAEEKEQELPEDLPVLPDAESDEAQVMNLREAEPPDVSAEGTPSGP